MKNIEDEKYALSTRLFDILLEEFRRVLNHIQNLDKIRDIEEFIKAYQLYSYQISNNDNKINEVHNNFRVKGNPLENFSFGRVKIDDRDTLFKFKYNISSSLLTTILLYKKGYLPEMVHNPLNFIKSIIQTIIPNEDGFYNLGDRMIEHELRELLNDIGSDVWHNINQKPYTEISIFYWGGFDNEINETDYSLHSTIKRYIENCSKNDHFRSDVYLQENHIKSYNQFFKSLDDELQTKFKSPDILFLDTSLIAEYKSKGILIPFASIVKREKYENFYFDKQVLELGKTLNGVLDSFPISRSFHTIAKSSLKNSKVEFNLEDGIEINHIIDQVNIKIGKWGDNSTYDTENQNKLFAEEISKDELIYFENYTKLIIDIPHVDDIIPMQLARGAHATYTIFAYLANCVNHQQSLLKVTHYNKTRSSNYEVNPLKISCYSKQLIEKRLSFYLKLVFTSVPVISLSLDHVYSGYFRDKYEDCWFDLCLPLEAVKFQKTDIKFNKIPLRAENNKPLSCIGGYTLAISHDCDNPYKAVEIIKDIAQDYFIEPITKEKYKSNQLRDLNCRIIPLSNDTNYKNIVESTEFKDIYISTPENLAKRPNFFGWKEIETIISEIIRLHVLILFIFRQQYFKDSGKNRNYNNNISLSKTEIKTIITNYKKIIFTFFNKSFNHEKRPLAKEKFLEHWLEKNFDNFLTEDLYIKEMVNEMFQHYQENPGDLNGCIKKLSNRTAEVLYSKIKSYCDFNGHYLEEIS